MMYTYVVVFLSQTLLKHMFFLVVRRYWQTIHEYMLQNNTRIHVATNTRMHVTKQYTNTCCKQIHEYMLQNNTRIHVTNKTTNTCDNNYTNTSYKKIHNL